MSLAERQTKLDRCHALPLSRQCKVLAVSRSSAYRPSVVVNDTDMDLIRKLDALHLRHPFKDSRRLRADIWDDYGLRVNRKCVQRLMRMMDIRALYSGARTTRPNPQHKVYLYLLRDRAISRVNRSHLFLHAQRLSVPGRHHGLALQESARMAPV